MQLSLHSDYALRTLMALSSADALLSVDEIARRHGVSRNHLAKVAQRLQAEGFISTFRGRSGGMRLARPADEIVIGDVVRRFERLESFVACFPEGQGCAITGVCGLQPALAGALEAFLAHLDTFRLTDLLPDHSAFERRMRELAA